MATNAPAYVLIVGNPGDGLTFTGPFSDGNDANDYGGEHHASDEYWVMNLLPPYTLEAGGQITPDLYPDESDDQTVSVDAGDLLEACQAANAWAGQLRAIASGARRPGWTTRSG